MVTTADPSRGEIHHELPACLPDGRFLYFRHLVERGTGGIYLGDPDVAPGRQILTPLLVADGGPVLVGGAGSRRDQLLFMKGEQLFVQQFNVDRVELAGQPTPVDAVFTTQGSGYFSVSQTGLLV